jgi:transposase
MSRHGSNYPRELRERAVRMVAEVKGEYPSQWAAIGAVASKLGIGSAETLRKWVRRAEIDAGQRPGLTGEEHAEIKRLKRENAELRRANEILKAASSFFARELCATTRRVDRGGVRDLSRWAVAAAR